ncbi:putative syntaxin-like protein psy1 [Venustampulla echinocandica]|uniref:Putative syntaxin-like protein psy1 n=1 Tax=Venustampulla echinocandica TaxID=2656787 RepID=A0A370TUG0_9HELO|nr:putative syntaxin-like protein psy1 [Venustampulla echinocandica]RDL39154.1 putative syntaxin-like protein psy1 [Venustampulla echinocandica]
MSYTQYQQHGGNPYNNGPDAEAGRGGVNGQDLGHEMSGYSATSQYSSHAYGDSGAPAPSSTILTQQDFLARVALVKSEIRTLSSNIQEIAALHQRALSSPDSNSSAQLENLVTQTQLKNTQIRDQIKFLEADELKTQDGTKKVKTKQAKQLKGEFERALKDYQQEEVGYRQRYREQIARQYKIVNPDASDTEVQEASEMDWGSEGVFQTALKSNRSGQASSVLGAVRARHNELQRIEATLTDLAAMFADMAQIVEVQDPVIAHTEENAVQTAADVDKANTEIDKAQEHARRRRRNKWWCLLIVVLIVLALALGIGLGIGLTKTATSKAT